MEKQKRKLSLKKPPKYLSEFFLNALKRQHPSGTISFEFSSGEKHSLRKHKEIPISEWAVKYRVLESSSIRGQWQNIYTPYLVGIMDAANMPGVETVIMCKSPQTGGSECGHNLVGYCIDRLPGPVMYVFPDEKTAKENARDRIIPMILSSPRLKRYLTKNEDDVSMYHIKLIHMHIYLAWSGSVARLGNKPIRILILDELDKYENPKSEARSEDLATKRTTTWRSRRKIFKISTPTTEDGPIWVAYTQEANARFMYHVVCPDCSKSHIMQFENIAWPKKGTNEEPSGEEVYSKNLAYYVCPHCGSCWDDEKRNLAVRAGQWREESTEQELAAYIEANHPKKVGFHVPAWLSYFVSLSEIAMSWLKYSQGGDIAEFKNFQNQYAAEPWHEQFETRKPEDILLRCDDRPRGFVPGKIDGKARVATLIAGVDTQLRYFRYCIRAIGFGKTGESWLIQEGTVPSFEALEDVLFHSEYEDPDGEKHRVRAVIIDAMGELRRTYAVYEWATRHRGVVFPSQGVHRLTGGTWRMTQLEYYPTIEGRTQKIPGGLNLYRLDTTFYKNMLAARLAIAPDDPGAFHLHNNDNDQLTTYVREMSAEMWDPEEKGGTWICPPKKANHAWDCEYLIQALADIMQIRKWVSQDEASHQRPQGPTVKIQAQQKPMSISDRLGKMRSRR